MSDPYRPPRAALTDSRVDPASSIARGAVPTWILIFAALGLNHLAATYIMPLLFQVVHAPLLNRYRAGILFEFLASPYSFFSFSLTIALVLHTIIIYGAWSLSRGRRLSFVILIGLMLALDDIVFGAWSALATSPPLWYVLGFPAITAAAVAISYAWARRTARTPAAT